MKKTTIKISYDLFWEIEMIRVKYQLKSKDEAIRYILSKIPQNALKQQKGVSDNE